MPDQKSLQERTGYQSGIGGGVVTSLDHFLRFRDSEFYAGSADYSMYRRMMRHPTLRLAYAFVTAPIISSGWSVEADDDADERAVELISDVFTPARSFLLQQACRSIYYGHQCFEKVWAVDEDGRYVIKRFKPLLPDLTEVIVDEFGNRIGLKNRGVVLNAGQMMQISNDVEADYWYGRSRLENVREFVWGQWCATQKKLETFQSKAAGVLPIVTYPEGNGVDKNGAAEPNWRKADMVLNSLGRAAGVTIPNMLAPWAEDVIRGGGDVKELMAWKVQFLEAAAGHGAEFITVLSYDDKLLVRGMLAPERAILEGQYGTKAEAETHGDVGIAVADQTLHEIVSQINEQSVNDVLRTNFGESQVGKVYLKASPLIDEAKSMIREIVKATYVGAPDLARVDLSFDAMNDQLGLPKAQETIDDEPAGDQDVAAGVPEGERAGADAEDAKAPAPRATTPGAAGVPDAASVQQTAMTGVQIQALQGLVEAIANGVIPADAAKQLAYIAFPLTDRNAIDKMFDSAAAFKPTAPSATPNAQLAASLSRMMKSGTKPPGTKRKK